MRTTVAWLVAAQLAAQAAPTLELTGQVVDMWGDAVPAARVQAFATGERERVLANSPTDGEGAFRLAKLPGAGPWRVRAWTKSTNVAEALVDDPTVPLRLVVFDAITLRGVVRNRDGAPVAGAAVEATPRLRNQAGSVATTTDAGGAFTIANLPRGLIHVLAAVPREGLHIASVRASGDTTVTLTPWDEATRSLTLRVDGLPAHLFAKTLVEVTVAGIPRLPCSWRNPILDTDTLTLPDVPVRNVDVALVCAGVRFQPAWQRYRASETGELRFRAEVMKAERCTCRLRLLDPEGRAVSSSPVVLTMTTPCARVEARTDTAGFATFVVMAWPNSKGRLGCLDPQWAALAVPQGARDRDLEFRLDEEEVQLQAVYGAAIAGRILTPAGTPAPGVIVAIAARAKEGEPWSIDARVVTGGDGTFRVPGLARNALARRVEAAGGFAMGKELTLADGDVTIADLQLVAPATIRGIVRNRAGQPAPGVRVWHRHWDLARDRAADGEVREVVTDAEGRYCLAATRPGGNFLQTLVDELDSSARAVEPFATKAGQTCVVDLTVSLP